MAITATPYGTFLVNLAQAQHDFIHTQFTVALLTSSYSPDITLDYNFDAVNMNELPQDAAAGGYQVGGSYLNNKTISYDGAGNVATLRADDITWSNLTGTFRYAVLNDAFNGSTGMRMCGLFNFATDQTFAGAPFTMSFPSGIMTISGA